MMGKNNRRILFTFIVFVAPVAVGLLAGLKAGMVFGAVFICAAALIKKSKISVLESKIGPEISHAIAHHQTSQISDQRIYRRPTSVFHSGEAWQLVDHERLRWTRVTDILMPRSAHDMQLFIIPEVAGRSDDQLGSISITID